MKLIVIKKDGTKEAWNWDKIKIAVSKASERANYPLELDGEDFERIKDRIIDYFADDLVGKNFGSSKEITTNELHYVVLGALDIFKQVKDAYKEYRDYKNTYAKAFETIKNDADTVLFLGDKENANFDSSLISTKGSLIKGYLTKELYKQFYLSVEEKDAIKHGFIYIHDLRDMIFGSINCCLFDIGKVLKGGFEMSNVTYTEPTSVLSALQVIGDVTLVATAQQFGGFTLAEIDKVLLPYCKKTLAKNNNNWLVLTRELEQGFQSLELKLNTVPCSRGDFAFTTLTFGEWSLDLPEDDQRILYEIIRCLLSVRLKGHGGRPVVFPKLVYLYAKEQHNKKGFKTLWHDLAFSNACACSSKCMYPDYLSIDSDYGFVSKLYKEHGVITSPMGGVF